jgi:hypothetical protein
LDEFDRRREIDSDDGDDDLQGSHTYATLIHNLVSWYSFGLFTLC